VSPDTIRRRLVVFGQVQGVFFRDSTRRAAQDKGVSGWAANRRDGSVEVVLEGRPPAVEAVVEFCRRGPARAWVDRVDEREEPPEGLTGFVIR
jgi:acylphosphatase